MRDPRAHPLTRRDANAAILSLLALGSCGPIRSPRIALGGHGDATLLPSPRRVDLVPGHTLLMPVRVEGPLPGSATPVLTLSNGRTVEGKLVWVGIRPEPAGGESWLPPPGRWVVTPVSEGAVPASVGAWHVIADLPAEAVGQSIRLGDRPIPANWLADPDELRPETAPVVWGPWRTAEGTPKPDPDLLAPEWRSPLRRWRARLVAGTLGSAVPAPTNWAVEGDPIVLDRLARLTESRWRVGLARLWYADARACRDLTARLGRTLEIKPGVHAPAWPVSQPLLESLLDDLLDPNHTGQSLIDRARGWLDSLPATAAWVEDDAAGLLGQGSEPLARLRAARLAGAPAMLWLAGRDGLRVGEPAAIEPGELADLSAPVGSGQPATGAATFALHAGSAPISLPVRQPIAIRPPGASCGPLLYDWTLDAWSTSDPLPGAVPDPARAAALLIYPDEIAPSDAPWAAYIECGAPEDGSEEVALYFGQRGAPAAVLRVTRDGVLRNDLTPDAETRVDVAAGPERWSVALPIPREAIEPNNTLRLGVTRRDARGVRTAWPRRMMPWDREPSRAAISLSTWSGLPGS